MRLYLINPRNSLISLNRVTENRWNRYRVWKPLSLMVIAGLTPPPWQVRIIDENLAVPDYDALPRPDLVGITSFTPQAGRAYEVAASFRARGVPVVMGGIHATMRHEEALARVDAVVTGEAESVWAEVLDDAAAGTLAPLYRGERLPLHHQPLARQDLAPPGYVLGAVQTTRGCPLSCSFCSVSAFNGHEFRLRPVSAVVDELRLMGERQVLIADDNLIGTRPEHIERAKELFRAMIGAGLRKRWVTQVTINMADDEELLRLARASGCMGVLVGFESPSAEGLREVHKRFNLKGQRDLRASVRRIQRHGIMVVGSFMIGLEVDRPGIGRQLAEACIDYHVDSATVLYYTPFPGTRLWDRLSARGDIVRDDFPADWKYYTLTHPVARHEHLSWRDLLVEKEEWARRFYSHRRIARRIASNVREGRVPVANLAINYSYRKNALMDEASCHALDLSRGAAGSGG